MSRSLSQDDLVGEDICRDMQELQIADSESDPTPLNLHEEEQEQDAMSLIVMPTETKLMSSRQKYYGWAFGLHTPLQYLRKTDAILNLSTMPWQALRTYFEGREKIHYRDLKDEDVQQQCEWLDRCAYNDIELYLQQRYCCLLSIFVPDSNEYPFAMAIRAIGPQEGSDVHESLSRMVDEVGSALEGLKASQAEWWNAIV
ncbi:uncharacterized protein B0H18DRAFT_1005151 [Fomitopsis serialis]|uniref:uncharacterized protein n=1 Tax=Fomitopsis serialis TaxID=139415 RepID=UPI00200838D5|nr:uncharacterized protein B0H18DRAFT_1005151 [Neoantrodia serialis]KAH9926694.1 hypothetical protein B0H18DRAFT_1005151 [Neoantrodia serialis]